MARLLGQWRVCPQRCFMDVIADLTLLVPAVVVSAVGLAFRHTTLAQYGAVCALWMLGCGWWDVHHLEHHPNHRARGEHAHGPSRPAQ